MNISSLLRKFKSTVLDRDFETYGALRLPVIRFNEGLNSNDAYIAETAAQIDRAFGGKVDGLSILDFGCGQGRLLNGLIHGGYTPKEYVGIDLNKKSITWCIRNLHYQQFSFAFVWYNKFHARYNASGSVYDLIPVRQGYFDAIFSNSVFSHLDTEDVALYAKALRAAACNGASLYLTAFTEDDVENCTHNPRDYLGRPRDDSPLNRVRYNRVFFIDLFEKSGWELTEYQQGGIARTGQSELYFKAVS